MTTKDDWSIIKISNGIDNIKKDLYNKDSINDILIFGFQHILYFPTEIKKRIEYLIECAEEELKSEITNKIEKKELKNNLKESLKDCLYFLIRLEDYKEPVITLHPDNFFGLEWEADKNNCIILQFYSNKQLQYLFFTPNKNMKNERNIIQGFTDINEIFNLFDNLELNAHKFN